MECCSPDSNPLRGVGSVERAPPGFDTNPGFFVTANYQVGIFSTNLVICNFEIEIYFLDGEASLALYPCMYVGDSFRLSLTCL